MFCLYERNSRWEQAVREKLIVRLICRCKCFNCALGISFSKSSNSLLCLAPPLPPKRLLLTNFTEYIGLHMFCTCKKEHTCRRKLIVMNVWWRLTINFVAEHDMKSDLTGHSQSLAIEFVQSVVKWKSCCKFWRHWRKTWAVNTTEIPVSHKNSVVWHASLVCTVRGG